MTGDTFKHKNLMKSLGFDYYYLKKKNDCLDEEFRNMTNFVPQSVFSHSWHLLERMP